MKTKGKAKHFLSMLLCCVMVLTMLPMTAFAEGEPEQTTCTITFEMNGHGTPIEAQNVEQGQTAEKPEDPTEEGYTFKGWYMDKEYTTEFDFTLPLKTDYTLYAKWEQDVQPPVQPTTHTVTFDMGGYGEQVAAQTVEDGKKATEPATPTADGWTFMEWQLNTYDPTTGLSDFVKFDFNTPITEDITLGAYWLPNISFFEVPVPIRTIVELGGNVAPGETTFSYVLTPGEYSDEVNDLVISGNTVAVNGKEQKDSTITLKGTFPNNTNSINFTLTEKNDGEANWTYDESSYIVIINREAVQGPDAGIHEYTYEVIIQKEKKGFNPIEVDVAEFTNTYTKNQSPAPTTYTVTFDMNGHGTQINAQTVNEGAKASKPADPTAEGYTFKGWYADEKLSTAFDFETAIKADTTVYAKWEKKDNEPAEPTNPSEPANPTNPGEPANPVNPNTGATIPQTGDNSNMGLWSVLAAISLFGMAALTFGRKRFARRSK